MKFKTDVQWKKSIVLIFFFLVVTSVFYYSWLPYSNLRTESYLPAWILTWSNKYINLRTSVPFVAVGYLLECWMRIVKPSNIKIKKQNQVIILLTAFLIVCLAEAGQFFIADRHPDLMDVFFGTVGAISGSLYYHLIRRINSIFFN